MSRAEAVMKAIDMSDPGDSVTIHEQSCTDPNICTCTPRDIYVGGTRPRRPIGFRMDRDR